MSKVYFITNRNIDPSKPIEEWKYPINRISTGEVEVKKEFLTYRLDQDTLGFYIGTEEERINQIFDEIKNDQSDIIIYIHGFSKTLDNSICDSVRIYDRLNLIDNAYSPHMVVFSWPSDGQLSGDGYISDKDDAKQTKYSLAYTLKTIKNLPNRLGKKIHLIAHSMGNFVLRHGFNQYKINNSGALNKIFNEIALVEADDDNDAFSSNDKFVDLNKIADRVNIFFNNNDHALNYSDAAFNNFPRLGAVGPDKPGKLPSNVKLYNETGNINSEQHEYLIKGHEDDFYKEFIKVLKGI